MSRRAPLVVLSSEERVTLESWAKARSQPQRWVQRAQVVLLGAEGIENQEIAARLRISRPTVQLWRQRFLVLRATGLEKDAPRPGRIPRITSSQVAAIVEATLHGFYSAGNEAELSEMGVKQISVPNRSTKSPERRHQKKRSFRRGQKWRTGMEGRISVLKRRHGLNRCRYRGDAGMQRWVGLGGVIADNLINIGTFRAANNTG